jgi:hypothetical protein
LSIEKDGAVPYRDLVTILRLVDAAVWRIRDVYPGSRILIFTHPGSRIQKQQQKRGVKNFLIITFYAATNFSKLQIILVLECRRKKFKEL